MEKNIISVELLQDMLNKHQPVYILDVRPQDQREEWHIAGSNHKDVYNELKANNFSALDMIDFPENTPVVTVCAAGKTSLIAAEALRKKGVQAFSLEGGMMAWNYAWNTAELETPDFKVIQVRRVAKGCLSYVIGSGKEAIVVDASLDPEVYLSIARQHGWEVRYVMDTHIHADYLSRTRQLAAASGAKHIFIEDAGVDYTFEPVKDGKKITLDNTVINSSHARAYSGKQLLYDKQPGTSDRRHPVY